MVGTKLRAKQHVLGTMDTSYLLEPAVVAPFPTAGSKIVATLGPSTHEVNILSNMLVAGMAYANVDLTWGPLDYHMKSLDMLQHAMKKRGRLCGVMVSTLGREVMVRRVFSLSEDGWPSGHPLHVLSGEKIVVTSREEVEASASVLPVTCANLPYAVLPGDTLYVGRYLSYGATAEGSLRLLVKDVDTMQGDIICEAQNTAMLDGLLTVFHPQRGSQGLSNMSLGLPILTEYDKHCIAQLAQDYEIDTIAISHTRSGADIQDVRTFLHKIGLSSVQLAAKVETREALYAFNSILNEADAIIMSRGNLGLDCEPEKMACIQKALITSCNLMGKPVLVTRVVDTMVESPRPTRAEATDVANAVLDGADGFMMGAETLRGKYPVDCIQTLVKICQSAEVVFDHHRHYEFLMTTALEHRDAYRQLDSESPSSDEDPLPPSSALPPLPHKHLGSLRSTLVTKSLSNADFSTAVRAMAGVGSTCSLASLATSVPGTPYLSKLESIASSAVRAADKVGAGLIVVFTHTSKTAQLVAKYRPTVPILTLVVPTLVSDGIKWSLKGRSYARQCLLTRGLVPMLSPPGPSGDEILDEALAMAVRMGLVKPHSHVVVVERIHESFAVKLTAINERGTGLKVVQGPAKAMQSQDVAALAGRLTQELQLVPPSPVVGRRATVTAALQQELVKVKAAQGDQRFSATMAPTMTPSNQPSRTYNITPTLSMDLEGLLSSFGSSSNGSLPLATTGGALDLLGMPDRQALHPSRPLMSGIQVTGNGPSA